jgi:PAS domain S-box-containing protein
MVRMRSHSIIRRLTWLNMLVSGAALLLACGSFATYETFILHQNMARGLSVQAQMIAANNASALIFNDQSSTEASLATLRSAVHVTSAWIYGADGQPFAGFQRDTRKPVPALPPGSVNSPESHWYKDGLLHLVSPIFFQGKLIGYVYMQSDLGALYDRLRSFVEIGICVLLASLLLAFSVSWASSKFISRPILDLAETARIVMRDKDFSVRAPRTGSGDEISALIDAFNDMLARIQERDETLLVTHDALVEERYLLHTLMDNLPDMIYFKDRASRFTRVSKSAAKMLGLDDATAAVGKTDFDFFAPEHAQDARNDELKIMETGQPLVAKEEHETWLDGRETWALSTKMPMRDANGTIIGTFGHTHDITKRKQGEFALRTSEEHFRSLFENMLNGYVYCKMLYDGDEPVDYVYLDVNKSFEPLTGLKNVIGRKASDVIPGIRESDPHVIAAYGRVARSGKPEQMETYIESMKMWFSISLYSPKRDHFVAVFDQITERKQSEAALQSMNEELERRVKGRTAELEAANKELEAFTYSVSHDLRAPLRRIDGFSKLVVDETSSAELSEDAKRFISYIRPGAKEMGMLVDDLLNLARVARAELQVQVAGLGSIVNGVVGEVKRDNEDRAIEWVINPLPFVECDPTLMRQVFVNLISNAVKYSRPRSLARIEIGAENRNGDQVIYVKDNGVGFSMKYVNKLFGVFQRLHRPEDFEGTGVGLATVQRIIHKHGGRVWAEATLDQGAAFYFTLQSPASEMSTQQRSQEGTGERYAES